VIQDRILPTGAIMLFTGTSGQYRVCFTTGCMMHHNIYRNKQDHHYYLKHKRCGSWK
jgi:hypothetical protein